MYKYPGKTKKGGITLVALIFTIVLSTLIVGVFRLVNTEYSSAIRSLNRESAFHIAEGGIEVAMSSLKYGINLSEWTEVSTLSYQYERNGIDLGDQAGNLKVLVDWQGDDNFLVSSIGTVVNGGKSVQRAVQTEVTVSSVSVTPESGDGVYNYALFTRKGISFQRGNNGGNTFAGSYDSDEELEPKKSVGYNTTLVSLISDGQAMNLSNIKLWGTAISKGGTFNILMGMSGNQANENAVIKGKHSPANDGYGIDRNMLITDPEFEGTVSSVSVPSSEGYDVVTEIHQNDKSDVWANGSSTVINKYDGIGLSDDGGVCVGSFGKTTYIKTPYADISKDLYVSGDVVIYSEENLNLNRNVYFVDENATLTIAGEATLSVTGDIGVYNGERNNPMYTSRPGQFTLLACGAQTTAGTASQDIVIHSDRFVGVIDGPSASVQLDGNVKSFLGAIVADSFSATGVFDFFYDVQLGNSGGGDDTGDDASNFDVGVESWKEVPPSEVASLF